MTRQMVIYLFIKQASVKFEKNNQVSKLNGKFQCQDLSSKNMHQIFFPEHENFAMKNSLVRLGGLTGYSLSCKAYGRRLLSFGNIPPPPASPCLNIFNIIVCDVLLKDINSKLCFMQAHVYTK